MNLRKHIWWLYLFAFRLWMFYWIWLWLSIIIIIDSIVFYKRFEIFFNFWFFFYFYFLIFYIIVFLFIETLIIFSFVILIYLLLSKSCWILRGTFLFKSYTLRILVVRDRLLVLHRGHPNNLIPRNDILYEMPLNKVNNRV